MGDGWRVVKMDSPGTSAGAKHCLPRHPSPATRHRFCYNRAMNGNTICLVFDRLHSGYLGAYGNAWIETPEFDRFASQGFVFDQLLIDSPQLDWLYRSYWLGRHAGCAADQAGESLIARLNRQQIETVLLTDDAQVAGHRFARDFRQRIEIDPVAVGGWPKPWTTPIWLAASPKSSIGCHRFLSRSSYGAIWPAWAHIGTPPGISVPGTWRKGTPRLSLRPPCLAGYCHPTRIRSRLSVLMRPMPSISASGMPAWGRLWTSSMTPGWRNRWSR